MEYLNIKNNKDKLSFEVKGDIKIGLDKSIVNGIRRTLISDIKTVSFNTIKIQENNTVLHNEFYEQRLSLIPLNIDPENYNNKYIFIIDVTNDSDEDIKKIDTRNFTIHPLKEGSKYKDIVTIDDYDLTTTLSDNIRNTILKPFIIRDITSYILITELKSMNSKKEKQSLKLYCIPSVGVGSEHSKYNNISHAVYTFHKDDKLFNEMLKNQLKIKNIKDKDEIKSFTTNYILENSERIYHRDINTEPYWYDIEISSYHHYSPIVLYKQAIENIIIDLQNCIENFELLVSDKNISKFKYVKKNKSFVFILVGYDDTIGNIIQSHVVNTIDSKSFITVCGYRKVHPQETYIELSLTPKEDYSNDSQTINFLVINIVKIINKIIDILNDMNSKI